MISRTRAQDESWGVTLAPFHTCCCFKMWCHSYSCDFPAHLIHYFREDFCICIQTPPSLRPPHPAPTTTALTATSCQQGQILTCSVARLLPGWEPHFPPPAAATAISKRWLCPTELITVKSKDASEESLIGNDPIIQGTCRVWLALPPVDRQTCLWHCFTWVADTLK